MTWSPETDGHPVTVMIVSDYDVVVDRLRAWIAPFRDRVVAVDDATTDAIGAGDPHASVEVALIDATGGRRHAVSQARALVLDRAVDHVVVCGRGITPAFRRAAEVAGADQVIDLTLGEEAIVDAIEAAARRGDRSSRRRRGGPDPTADTVDDELLALVVLGLTDDQIADETFSRVRTVRTNLERMYDRLDVEDRAGAEEAGRARGLVPRRTPGQHGTTVRSAESTSFRRAPSDVRAARVFVAGALQRLGASDAQVARFRLAVSELASNAVVHGSRSGWSVAVGATDEWYTLDVSGGRAEPDDHVLHPDEWEMADVLRPTGRGLGIVKRLMDDVTAELWRGHVRIHCRMRRDHATDR